MFHTFKNIFFILVKKYAKLANFIKCAIFLTLYINCSIERYNNIVKPQNICNNKVSKINTVLHNNNSTNTNYETLFFLKNNYFLHFIKDHIPSIFFKNFFMSNTILYPPCLMNFLQEKSVTLSEIFKNSIKCSINHDVNFNYSQKNCEYVSSSGEISKRSFENSKSFGLDINEIQNIIEIIKYQINYHKLKINNPFSFLIKKNILDIKVYKNKIIGFKIHNNKLNYYGVVANNGKFYDHQGYSLTETFLKFPSFKRYRISSSFNLHRLNPITKKISQHQGIDIAMPVGTPILSIGNGEITKIKSSTVEGKYVTIKHNFHYVTKYMHLKTILVKVGDKVKKGEKIGLSGNTGYSTGPHLHYEIWLNNRVINPEKLVIFEKLSRNDLKVYLKFLNSIFIHLKNI
ncbi:MAG: peptidoglycan DD-metalloendopeptidase family protein [Buchnera aphidicola (Nurudea shiraii)]